MTKPTTPFQWATNAAYGAGVLPWSATANKTAPVAGLIAEGWEPVEHPAADNLNWNFNLLGQWSSYLDSGDLEGDHSIDGALTIAGPVVAQDDLQVGVNLEVAGNVTVTGEIYRASQRTLRVPASAAGRGGSGGGFINFTGSALEPNGAVGGFASYPIAVETGTHIKSFLVFGVKLSSAATTLTAVLRRVATNGAATALATVTNSGNAPGVITLASGAMDVEVGASDADACYQLDVFSSTGATGDLFTTCEIDVTYEG